ncbi:hypothetical protein [uncultured Rhodospira sp.]|uniref:hypothetical protein n=1 Tax=uncultured Rhodospira sp. TaxID=1936189 RepID=UPI002621A30F|nr:hypothetical protein [uncultured Rhodospira sp.]
MGTDDPDSTPPPARPETPSDGGPGTVTADLESTQLVDLDGDAPDGESLGADGDSLTTKVEAQATLAAKDEAAKADSTPFVILDDAIDGVTGEALMAAFRHDT